MFDHIRNQWIQVEMDLSLSQFSGCSLRGTGIKARVGTQAVTKEDTVENMEKTQRDHMNSRLYAVFGTRQTDYMKQFNLVDDDRPANAEEAVERIKAGQYMIRKKNADFDDGDDDEYDYDGAFSRIYWRDPSKVKDQAGYKAAMDAMNKEFENVLDTVKLAPYADAVAAFENFKKPTVH